MFRSYFILAWRNLIKNRLSSSINIIGLAIGLTVAILIFLVIDDNLKFDRFNKKYDDLYLLMKTQRSGEVTTTESMPGQLSAAVKKDLPEVLHSTRQTFEDALLNTGSKSLFQLGMYADPDFFRMMTFPAVSGDPVRALTDPNSVVLTESAAKDLFGDVDPIGRTLNHNNSEVLRVAAVIRDAPVHSSIQFKVIFPFTLLEKHSPWLTKWDDNRIQTWLQLKPGVNLTAVNQKLTALMQVKVNDKRLELFAYPMRDKYLRSSFHDGKVTGGRIQGMYLLGIIGGFVLLIACINFMNLSTARSEKRSREVGVRKTLGASRKELIFQFLAEAALLTFFALITGVLLAKLALPSFNLFIQKQMTLDLSALRIWLAIAAIGIVTALLAGSYPAFFLSRFKPVLVLKGIFNRSRSGMIFRKSLVTFQFMITIVLIISIMAIVKQKNYVQERPLGYTKDNLIIIPAPADTLNHFAAVKSRLAAIPGVISISSSNDDLTRYGAGTDGFTWPGKVPGQDINVNVSDVSYDWIRTAGLGLAEGRDFDPSFGTDSTAVLVNETAVRRMGLKEPVVGIKLGDQTIIGVIKDFVFNDVFNNPGPLVISLAKGRMDKYFVRIRNDGNSGQTMQEVEAAIKAIAPNLPFSFHFVSEDYDRQFKDIGITLQLMNITGIIAILISALGLFGLSTFLAEQRSKEIGIRKILGAGLATIWFNLSADFLKPVLIAFMLAAPLGGWIMTTMLRNFGYRAPLTGWIFAIAGGIAGFIALATVSFQGIRAAMANPVDSLRSE